MQNANSQGSWIDIECRCDLLDDHFDDHLAHIFGRRVETIEILETAPGHFIGDRAKLEIRNAGQFRHLAGGDRPRRGIAAENRDHFFAGNQAPGLADGLIVIDRIAALKDNLLALHSPARIDFIHRDFKTARAFLPQQRQAAAERKQRAKGHFGKDRRRRRHNRRCNSGLQGFH